MDSDGEESQKLKTTQNNLKNREKKAQKKFEKDTQKKSIQILNKESHKKINSMPSNENIDLEDE